MPWYWLLTAAGAIAVCVLFYFVGARATDPLRARADFLARRDELQEQFFQAAASAGKPRGLRWRAIDWGAEFELAREKATRNLTALVGATIHFEAVEGGEMEGVAAVGLPRNASAVFFYHARRWHTTGKTLFNLNPDEALAHFAGQYERVPNESDRASRRKPDA